MNKGQKVSLAVWLLLVGVVLIFPPWRVESQMLPPLRHPIVDPPTLKIMENDSPVLDRLLEDLPRVDVSYHVDWVRLFIIWGILSSGAAVALITLRGRG